MEIGNGQVEMGISSNDEMALVNRSQFYVCESCGYTALEEKTFFPMIKRAHKNSGGSSCKNQNLHLYDLGYQFKTDVAQIRFLNPALPALTQEDWGKAYSVLHGILRGFCSFFSVDERDVAGTLQYYVHPATGDGCYAIILYDSTPGGAGYVRMLQQPDTLELVLRETLLLMERCTCGGDTADTSCYTCLRNYYNQKWFYVNSWGRAKIEKLGNL